MLLGVDGTVHGRRERAQFFGRNADVPVMVLAVGAGQQIAAVLPELDGMLVRPLLTLERVRICKRDGDAAQPAAAPARPRTSRAWPLWQKIMIFTSEDATHHGPADPPGDHPGAAPGAAPAVRRRCAASGAFTARAGRTAIARSSSAGTCPTLTVVIDTPDRIAASFPIIDELTGDRGLVTSELIPAARTDIGGRGQGGLGLATHRW